MAISARSLDMRLLVPTQREEENVTRLALTVLCCLAIAHAAVAVNEPPSSPSEKRSWLCEELLADMGTADESPFTKQDRGRVLALSNPHAKPSWSVGNRDVTLLADYYYHTRARAEEDFQDEQRASRYQPQDPNQPPATTDKQREIARADYEEIAKLGGKLSGKGPAVKKLAQLIHASLPGFRGRENLLLVAPPGNSDPPTNTIIVPVPAPVYTFPYVLTPGGIPFDYYYPGWDGPNWHRHDPRWHDNRHLSEGQDRFVNPPLGHRVPNPYVNHPGAVRQFQNRPVPGGVRMIPIGTRNIQGPIFRPANQRFKAAPYRPNTRNNMNR